MGAGNKKNTGKYALSPQPISTYGDKMKVTITLNLVVVYR
jgi:hypothetical protein